MYSHLRERKNIAHKSSQQIKSTSWLSAGFHLYIEFRIFYWVYLLSLINEKADFCARYNAKADPFIKYFVCYENVFLIGWSLFDLK